MYNAHVVWTPGTENVTGQRYQWFVNAVPVSELLALEADVASRDSAADQVEVHHGDAVSFVVRSHNQWNESSALTIEGSAPTPTPEAPTGGAMSFSDIGGILPTRK